MTNRKVFDQELDTHFVTFSCFKRRNLLQHDRAKRIVLGQLEAQLKKRDGCCLGFVIMPDHIHLLIWFSETNQVSRFMDEWKSESSKEIKKFYESSFPNYCEHLDESSVWQARYYDFNVFTEEKMMEKLNYIHENPVRAGLVEKAIDWQWSSARWYVLKKDVGVTIRWP
ncbi:REP-associated tyrosine transposase [Calycomorphotria hydatis]|uniref:Transposase IS200 like protein n=1 Tax=Calycomorphotria hydatis TaxID=2528027 RepID=A0A517T5Y4_9PLAN|nr:transposase [Calycomorphotria hydatis]QDT63792.1 Transposase IS200 like protein [Calycomorphotria hydatis]